MSTFLKTLRQFFLVASLPPLAFFALFYFSADEPLVDERMHYLLMVILLLLILVGVLVLHFYIKNAEKKCIDKPWNEQTRIFGGAYKVRIVSLNVLSFLSSLLYLVTVDMNCVYSAGMLTLLILLSFPTAQYIGNGVDSPDESEDEAK
ncbi:MAG: hypothetical protein MJZ15_09755 [Bacteroidales bacterium]|nr:hypothetical protein [Bacteroidales bacterium]